MFESPLFIVFPAVMAFAGATDLLTMTIPNRVSLALVAAFFLVAPIAGLTWQDLSLHVAAGGIMLAIGVAMFAMGWFGGGDAKLLAAAALWIGLDQIILFLGLVAIYGGFLSVAVLMYRQMVPDALAALGPDWALRLHHAKSGIPYGVAIAAAALMIYPSTQWFLAF